jgi:hypothetical protein
MTSSEKQLLEERGHKLPDRSFFVQFYQLILIHSFLMEWKL